MLRDHIFDGKECNAYVRASVFESYLQHAELTDNFSEQQRNFELERIGRLQSKLNTLRNLEILNAENSVDEAREMRIEGLRAEIDADTDDLPGIAFFNNLSLSCSPDTFFEVLIMCIKNNSLLYQAHVYKKRTAMHQKLDNEIKELKKNFRENVNTILARERELAGVIESNLKQELKHMKIFDRLNNEKITPHFMALTKNSKCEKSLTDIRKEDGTNFTTEAEQNNYITSFYRDLYKKGRLNPDEVAPTIEEFLGGILEVEAVQAAKLSEMEKASLDCPLLISELDQSINDANFNSAPGINGISNKFIKKYWEFFRQPLFNCTKHIFETGTLTDSFKTAKIKLIPKKGDCGKIKNWRPISLLDNFYKIVSRLVTTRIRKYIDKLTPIGQKAYSKNRQCQEVVINIIDEIAKCKKQNKKAALVSLDIKKAFDSLSHAFVEQVLQFFNFGPNITRWIKTICFKRRACLVLTAGTLSDIFELERGNAQGDNISPYIFILCYQILLFRIEYDQQIVGIVDAPTHPPLPPDSEVRKYSKKIFAYADDANLLLKLEVGTFRALIAALEEYKKMSGLECNIDKTMVMQVGDKSAPDAEILDLGFSFVTRVTILGTIIINDTGNQDDNATAIRDKIKNQVRYWSRFNLSLPGRILIAKTMLYSQINYMGCFLPLSKDHITPLEHIIEHFVRGNLKISFERVFTEIKNGGLGLFRVESFLNAQKCSWVKRATNTDDLWKEKLLRYGNGNIYNLRSSDFDVTCYPILRCIAKSWETFYFNFCAKDENFRVAYIYDNPVFKLNRGTQNWLQCGVFGRDFFEQNSTEIKRLTFSQVLRGQHTIPFLPRHLLMLRGIVETAQLALKKRDPEQQTHVSIEDFMVRAPKGSKRYRNYLCKCYKKSSEIPHNIKKFSENTEFICNLETSQFLNKIWNLSFLDNATRTFIFKLHNNTLGYNYTVAHFVANLSPNCTFCDMSGIEDLSPETPLHLFYECPAVEPVILDTFCWVLGKRREENNRITRSTYFGMLTDENLDKVLVVGIICKIFQKYIWDCKQRHVMPAAWHAKLTIKNDIDLFYNCNKKFRAILERSTIDIDRDRDGP